MDETAVRELERFTARMVRAKLFPFEVVAAVLEERRRILAAVRELLELLEAGKAIGLAAHKLEHVVGFSGGANAVGAEGHCSPEGKSTNRVAASDRRWDTAPTNPGRRHRS
jgi:hypothetical protein